MSLIYFFGVIPIIIFERFVIPVQLTIQNPQVEIAKNITEIQTQAVELNKLLLNLH